MALAASSAKAHSRERTDAEFSPLKSAGERADMR